MISDSTPHILGKERGGEEGRGEIGGEEGRGEERGEKRRGGIEESPCYM